MKATGIVRRIDDLGRIVIPKEIRRTPAYPRGRPVTDDIGTVAAFQLRHAGLSPPFGVVTTSEKAARSNRVAF